MIDYKLLEALAMVIQEGGFEKAAAALHLTQSAVSQRVRQLEERTGQILLSRTTPPRVTAPGQQLLTHYRQVRLLEEGLAGNLTGSGEGDPVTLPVGINADSLASWFLSAIDPLLGDGQVLIDLHVDDQEQTHRLLKEGTVVGSISDRPTPLQGCRAEYLGTMSYRLLATPAFVAARFPQGFTLAACETATAVFFNRKDNLHHRFLRESLGSLPEKLRKHYVPAPEQFLQMVSRGYACGMIPDWQSRPLRDSGALVEVCPGVTIAVPLYWHCWNLASEPLQRFSGQLMQKAAALLDP